METNATIEGTALVEKTDVLIAIGAATAANCIPCFEHLYEKAVTSGITTAEIKRASQIAGLVKKGAHTAITSSIDDLIGSKQVSELTCGKMAAGPCNC
jgi:alkylhydroperoxidase/carboxymuconolactone decarboxylase family protein YurZ